MIHYTMLPNELIFGGENSTLATQQMINVNGCPLVVSKNANSDYEVVRNLSTDPSHYLDSRYTPGAIIPTLQ
ncbi:MULTISPECIES: YlzJ-like family protein [Priestia]|jgi:YlzJ-like protein|uniref:Ribonuclease n=2 Tax=Priestia TaxID=2800373 RepID=A0A1X7D888_9BACI|nr:MULTISPECIES: YlzJ-like family protein [Priestia]AKO93787.1 ribonuclease [Priestia filamentosa]MDT3764024.1 YlzJ-like family protein [Priestia filamentosa]MED4070175.1 YlzJ-like family protein [Priestia endophytica]OXS71501.1 ribonuclease [Priestia filamentosa]RAS79557.1 ribonuclease [Priestia endophytica]